MRHDIEIQAYSGSAVKDGGSAPALDGERILRLPNGDEHPIAHLVPMTLTCPCEPIGRDLSIRVTFKNHCYTEGFDPEKHAETDILFREGADRHRVFCPIRYGLSHQLPSIMASLPARKVHQTAQARNYVYVVPLEVENVHYEIYFMLQRAAAEDRADLRLTVESAYSNGAKNIKKRPREIRFVVLAYKVLTNQPVRFAAR